VLKVFPISELSRTPTARFDQLQKLLEAGAITLVQFRRLWRMPDLRSEMKLDTATSEVIEKTLYFIAFRGKYLSPESFDDLPAAIAMGRKMYNMMRIKDGFPAERLMLLMQFVEEAERLENEGKAGAAQLNPAPAAPMVPGGPPPMPGAPMPGAPPPQPMPMPPPVAA
jgi:hypothetical protein